MAASARARFVYPDALCQAMRPWSAICWRWRSRSVGSLSAVSLGTARINGYAYLSLVETVREDGRAKQRIIKNLGRKEVLAASGALERLASSVARYAERAVVLSQLETGNP